MKAILDNFMEKPLKQRLIISGVAYAVILIIAWMYMITPLMTKETELRESVDEIQSKIATETRLLKELPVFKREVSRLLSLEKLALNQLPKQQEIPDLLDRITNLAAETGLKVSRFAPQPEKVQKFYAEVPVQVELECSYHEAMNFFDEVSRLSRIVSIGQIRMYDAKGSQDELNIGIKASLLLTTYRYLSDEERIKIQEEESAKGDKKARKSKAKNKRQ